MFCKYYKDEVTLNIKHEYCTNPVRKEISKSLLEFADFSHT